jgi:hypothetical protein
MFMNFLRKYQYQIFLITIGVFLLGTFIGFGGYFFTSQGSSGDSIAEVNGEKIPLRVFFSHYDRALDAAQQGGQKLDENGKRAKRDEAMRDLVQSIVFDEEAKRFGINVPDQQVVVSLASVQAFQEKGAFSPRLYMQSLQSQLHLTPLDFEEEQRRSIAFFKLRWLIQSTIKITDKEFEMEEALKRQGKPFKNAKEKDDARQDLWQEKVLYSFNQWFSQIGRDLKVKTHFEMLEGQK